MATKLGTFTSRGLEDVLMPILRACHKTSDLKKIHAQMEKLSLLQSNFLVTRMVDICDQNGDIDYANLLFKRVLNPNNFLYNAMLRAYTHTHMYILAITLFRQMLTNPKEDRTFPDRYTYPFVLRSCGGLPSLCLGKNIHGHVCKHGLISNDVVVNSLLDMYVKCDGISDACKVFDEMSVKDSIAWNCLICGHMKFGQEVEAKALFEAMPNKTIVSWTAMISGYTKIGSFMEALDVFRRMQIAGVQPDWISLVAVLPACAQLGALELGKWIHFYAEKKGFLAKTCVSNALIEMYTKCGSMNQSLQVFNSMPKRDVISWSTMIAGLAHHGQAREAIKLFHEMQDTDIAPNEITFVGLLSACAHAGLLKEGQFFFNSMEKDYNIEPGIEHYGCMVDLFGRTGRISRALEVIRGMKTDADSAIWGSLLSACRMQRDLETAVIAMERLMELEPEDTGNVVLLANIYADLGKWEGVSTMRKWIRSKRMKKVPGCSLIEVNGVVEEFLSGDYTKRFCKDVAEVLDLLGLHQGERNDDLFEEDCV